MTDLTPISGLNQQDIEVITDSISFAKGLVMEQLKKQQGPLTLSRVLEIVREIAKCTAMTSKAKLCSQESVTQIIIESLKRSKEIKFNPKREYFELIRPSKGIFIDVARNLFTTSSRTFSSAVQIARNPNTLRTVATGGAAALASEAGLVTAAGVSIAAGGGYLLGLGINHIPTGREENGECKNAGDDLQWLFRNYYWNKQFKQDVLSDDVKKRIK